MVMYRSCFIKTIVCVHDQRIALFDIKRRRWPAEDQFRILQAAVSLPSAIHADQTSWFEDACWFLVLDI